MNIAEELDRLHQLHQKGALSDAEYAAAKERLLKGGATSQAVNDVADNLKKFRRSRFDRWLGGVCGGLGAFTGVESWVWRLIFVLAFLCGGTGLLAYLLAWIFIPEEELIGTKP